MQRNCDACGLTDDHPRHLHALGDGTTVMKHFDCCSETGCPDGSCDTILASLDKPIKGKALRKYVNSGAVDHVGTQLNEARAAAAGKATA